METCPLAGEFCGGKKETGVLWGGKKKKETGPLAGEFCGGKGD